MNKVTYIAIFLLMMLLTQEMMASLDEVAAKDYTTAEIAKMLATLDNVDTRAKDKTIVINRYRTLLTLLARECDLNPEGIAGGVNGIVNGLAENGIKETRLNMMEAAIRVSQEKPGLPCENYFTAYATLRSLGHSHDDAIQSMIKKKW
ncbi:MAG: hypothetical protein ACLQPD_09940 [Desulfomonilaceae bacterium]